MGGREKEKTETAMRVGGELVPDRSQAEAEDRPQSQLVELVILCRKPSSKLLVTCEPLRARGAHQGTSADFVRSEPL